MTLSENDQELLVRYLDGELNTGERGAFEARLAKEPPLQEGLAQLQLATRALHFGTLQQQVAAARVQHESAAQQPAKVRQLPWLRYGFSVAAVLLLVWIGTRLLQPVVSPEALYAQHFVEPEPAQLRGNDKASGLTRNYQAGNYRKLVDDVLNAHRMRGTYSVPPEQYFQASLAAMHLQEWPTALLFLDELASSGYREDADYYRALVFLRVKRYGEARALLEKIRDNPAHLYHRQVDASFMRAVRRLGP